MNKAKQVGFSLSALLLLGAGLTACTPASSPNNNNGAKTNSVRQSGIDQRNQGITGYNSTRTDGTYRTANHLATRVSQLPGVASAYVMVSGQTAYVAIHQAGGSGKGLTNGGTTGNTGTSGTTSSGGSTTGTGTGGTTGTTGSGMSGGTGGMMNGAFGGTSNGTGTGTTGTGNFGGTAGSWTGGNTGTRGSGTGINGLGSYSGSGTGTGTGTMSGSGTTTGTTGGFSGGTGAMSGDVDNDLKQRITNTVRQADPSIKNVYVSANPELFSHFRTFTSDMTTGRFGAGTHVLGDVIRRVFPTSR